MSVFAVIASLLTLAVLGMLLYPLLRPRAGLTPSWPLVTVMSVALVGGAALLYPAWSNWNWSTEGAAADSPAAMVGRLARRLEKQPDDLPGWLLLGRSYAVIGQYPLAARAYQRADRLAEGRNAEALLGLGETLIESGRGEIGGPAGRMFEKALEVDPRSIKALYYSAVAATERNELPLARERFSRLLQANPPENVRSIIEEQLRALDAQAATVAVVKIPVRVTLSSGVAAKARAGAPLFVLARIPGQRGPPLAVQRLDSRFPQDVELSGSDAVMGGAGFTAGQELEIEARVANGGSAISASGDPFGVVRVKAGAATRATIEINQLKP